MLVLAQATRRAAVFAAVAAALLAGLAAPSGAPAQAVDQTCLLALTDLDEGATNVLYPDDSAAYFSGAFTAVPGTEIRLTGRYPHARYMSWNVYDAALRPVDGLPDVAFEPDEGSTNPFRVGADRTAQQRSYTGRISFLPAPAARERNTLYGAAGQGGTPNPTGVFTYRIYIPDRDRDEFGDVGLPTAEVVAAGSGAPVSPEVCNRVRKPTTPVLNDALAAAESERSAEPSQAGTFRNPPRWRKFVNVASAVGVAFTDNPTFNGAGQSTLDERGGQGGFLSNVDNSYVSALTNRAHGQVVVTRFRAHSFPDTRPGPPVMPGGDLRYWSICQNDPNTQRFVGCINDDRAVIGPDGFATYVISTPNQRPENARPECGVNWLPWGPNARGVIIYRHMLPSPGFTRSVQEAKADREPDTMGDSFPVSRYFDDGQAFAALGCSRAGTPAALDPSAGTARGSRRCRSRRRFTVRVPRGTRSVRLGRRRLAVRRGRAVVDLRGRPRQTVRLRFRLRSGRVVTRRYRTCRPRRASS